MHLVDSLREQVVNDLYSLRAISTCWPVWRQVVLESVTDLADPDQVLAIGARLSEAFAETRAPAPEGQREQQSQTSAGGSAWEALVCWYLNLCLIGTTALVVKRRGFLAGPLTSAIAVKYGTFPVNSESDLMAVTFPPEAPFAVEWNSSVAEGLQAVNQALRVGALQRTALTVIQCKTNWNDNAQIPMLWDLVYKAGRFHGSQVSVGTDNFSPASLAQFRYSFVTVPTTQQTRLRPESTAVIRLRDLSGRNYWGHPTRPGVALALGEIFQSACIGPSAGNGVRASLRQGLGDLREKYDYFGL